MSYYRKHENPSSFRKLAAAMWKAPNDPTIFGSVDIDMTNALTFLEDYNEGKEQKITVTHLVVRATALVLEQYPKLNAKIAWGRILLRNRIDIFCQVATGGGEDLSGTKIDAANELSIAELATRLSGSAKRIRSGDDPEFNRTRSLFQRLPLWGIRLLLGFMSLLANKLNLHLPSLGMPRDPFGSAMVTSVGMFEVDTAYAPFTPIARCPFIVCVTQIQDRPWVVDGEVVPRPILRLCGTFDHRVIDGFQGGRMTVAIRDLLMHPEKLLTEEESFGGGGTETGAATEESD